MSSIQTLTTLDLDKNEIGMEGVQYLAQTLQENKVRHAFLFSNINLLLCLSTDTHHTLPRR